MQKLRLIREKENIWALSKENEIEPGMNMYLQLQVMCINLKKKTEI